MDSVGAASASETGERPDILGRIIECEIIPRLLLAQGERPREASARAGAGGVAPDLVSMVDEAVRLAVADDEGPFEDFVSALRTHGIEARALLLDVFAPVARRLGVAWERDEMSFVEVTLGLGRLHKALHRIEDAALGRTEPAMRLGHALVCVPPGEQHTFGAAMAAGLLRRDGWRVSSCLDGDLRTIIRTACAGGVELVVVGISCDAGAAGLGALLGAIRKTPALRRVGVIVGGSAIAGSAEVRERLGPQVEVANVDEIVARARALAMAGGRRL